MIENNTLSSCLLLLKSIFGDTSYAIAWLNYTHPSLGTSPLLAISRGQGAAVLKILKKMEQINITKTYD